MLLRTIGYNGLKQKVSDQALEIKLLKTSSAEISSASEIRDSSPSFASSQWRTPPLSKKVQKISQLVALQTRCSY